mgnify:CR=1 FL=1
MLPFGMVGSHKWVVLKAIMCTAASCGFRLDEVSDWRFVDGGRSHLRWRFQGRLRGWLSPGELRALGKDDAAVIAPFSSKADRTGKYFSNRPIHLPFDEGCPLNAANALRDMELLYPVQTSRERFPCFPYGRSELSWSHGMVYKSTKALVAWWCLRRRLKTILSIHLGSIWHVL